MKKHYKSLLIPAVFATTLLGSSLAFSADIATGTKFNLKYTNGLDLKNLTAENFYKKVIPLAKKDKEVNFYNFASNSFPPMLKTLIKGFEKQYGIKVNLYTVKNDLAVQQLLATQKAHKDAPTDLFLMSNNDLLPLLNENILANINLYKLLPSTQSGIPHVTDTYGIKHGGSYVNFHGNQIALGYNSSLMKEKDVPRTYAELLKYTQDHKKSVAITSPLRGGSGTGFLVGVAHSNLKTKACKLGWDKNYKSQALASKWVKSTKCFETTWEYLRKLYPNVEMTNGNADTLGLISNGVVKFGTVWEDMVYGEIQTGATNPAIRMRLVTDGMPGSYNGMIITSTAKHLPGALLLLDFFMSDKIQLEKLKLIASRSPKPSLSMDNIPVKSRKLLIPADQFAKYHFSWSSGVLENALRNQFISQVIEKVKK